MKRILFGLLFVLFLVMALPCSGALAQDTYLYYDVLSLVKGEDPAAPAFCEGLWSYEWLDSATGTFSLMGERQWEEETSFYSAPVDSSCRIAEGVMLFAGETCFPSVTFTAPADGMLQYVLFGYFREGSADATLHLYRGDTELSFWKNDPDAPALLIDCAVAVKAGEKLRLVVKSAPDAPFCISSAPTLTYQRDLSSEKEAPLPEAPLPAAPTGLCLTGLSEDGVYLLWDRLDGDWTYNLYANGDLLLENLAAPSDPVFIPCLPSTRYAFFVSAVGGDGRESAPSEDLNVFTPAKAEPQDSSLPASDSSVEEMSSSQAEKDGNSLLLSVRILSVCVGVLFLAVAVLVFVKLCRKP